MSTATRTTDGLVRHLVDDAAVFPPGDAPLPVAVERHRAHRGAWYSRFVGPLLVRGSHADELCGLVAPGERLRIALVARPGTDLGLLAPAVQAVTADARAEVTGIELPLAGRTALDPVLRLGLPLWVEVPASDDGRALDAVVALSSRLVDRDAAAGTARPVVRAKLRTGGLRAEDFPNEGQVADFVVGCVRRGLTFKLTAGLHHAVRHTDPDTGFEHHGVANLLAATWAATDGADSGDATALLAERDPQVLTRLLRALDDAGVAATRERFAAFGCCDVTEPLADLTDLGVVQGLRP